MIEAFDIPIKVISEMNWRGHWAERHCRMKKQKDLAYVYCLKHLGRKREWPGEFFITLTRLKGYRQRDYDDDNLRGAFKAVRDGIAAYLGIDDGSERIEWEYYQDKSIRPGIRVEIRG